VTARLLLGAVVIVLGILLRPPGTTAAPATDGCTTCHSALEGRLGRPTQEAAADVHIRRGLGCASCHGGNPRELSMDAHSRRAGFVGAPHPTEVPQFCARCHSRPETMRRFNPRLPTDQLARFQTSVHGRRLARGDPNVATCTSCHGVHPVRAVGDTASPVYPTNVPQTCGRCHADAKRMRPYGIAATQYEQYRASVHGTALLDRGNRQAPACNDCHDNHGAVPPGVTSVANVCAQCHNATRDLFVRSPHRAAFDILGEAECTVCHGTHDITFLTDEMVGARPPAVCARCHPGDSTGGQAAARIRAQLERLKMAMAGAETLLGQAARAGMDVIEAGVDLDEARTQLILSRAVTHTASPAEVGKPVAAGMAAAERARAFGQAAIAELAFRRRGLAVSLAVIVFVAVTVVLKIRELERSGR